MKILSVVGTRPEIIRLSLILKKLDKSFQHIHVNTSQNFSNELNYNFYNELGLKDPDYIYTSKEQLSIGGIIDWVDNILESEKPDCFVCLGDTNSVLSAYAAKKRKIPIFHLEAGNRCFDMRVPEEVNRKIVDSIADVNLCYTETAKQYLISEGFPKDRAFVVGSPLPEVIGEYSKYIKEPNLENKNILKENFILVSCHRHESVTDEKKLLSFVSAINKLSDSHKIILTLHPKLEDFMKKSNLKFNQDIITSKPFSYFEYLFLLKNAFIVLSDSGTITEESEMLKIKALNLRYTNERPEGFQHGYVPMVGLDYDEIMTGLSIIMSRSDKFYSEERIHDYRFKNVSEAVISIILSYTQYIKRTVYYENI